SARASSIADIEYSVKNIAPPKCMSSSVLSLGPAAEVSGWRPPMLSVTYRHAADANRILAWAMIEPIIGGGLHGDGRARGRILGRGGRPAQNHPYRHGCVLRVGRAARQSRAARQAGRGRRLARTRRRRRCELRSAEVWRAFGDAVDHRQAEMPRSDLCQA